MWHKLENVSFSKPIFFCILTNIDMKPKWTWITPRSIDISSTRNSPFLNERRRGKHASCKVLKHVSSSNYIIGNKRCSINEFNEKQSPEWALVFSLSYIWEVAEVGEKEEGRSRLDSLLCLKSLTPKILVTPYIWVSVVFLMSWSWQSSWEKHIITEIQIITGNGDGIEICV